MWSISLRLKCRKTCACGVPCRVVPALMCLRQSAASMLIIKLCYLSTPQTREGRGQQQQVLHVTGARTTWSAGSSVSRAASLMQLCVASPWARCLKVMETGTRATQHSAVLITLTPMSESFPVIPAWVGRWEFLGPIKEYTTGPLTLKYLHGMHSCTAS